MAQILTPQERQAVAYLYSPAAIRGRCGDIFALACDDRLQYFRYVPDQLEEAATYVVAVIRESYPTLDIPLHSRWRHFNVGGVDRLASLEAHLASLDAMEQARCRFDLVMTSVLLDAGAGAHWTYHEAETQQTYGRSEGLAVASFHMFLRGAFSSRSESPLQADAVGLRRVTESTLAEAMQVSATNPLLGMPGRVALLHALGNVVHSMPEYFGTAAPRVGHLFDYLRARAHDNVLPAAEILQAVLVSLSAIWPGRLTLGGVNLGDVWPHPQVEGTGLTKGLVPFHKLSQWLTYSLIEPLEQAGLAVTGLEQLTALAEYRNGGLLIDLGVLVPKHAGVLSQAHAPETAVIVEWRALTVALLDVLADRIRQRLGCTATELPLVKILEGGTWRAGRQIAYRRRPDGGSPVQMISDGTVF
jgi:hypothetical protein